MGALLASRTRGRGNDDGDRGERLSRTGCAPTRERWLPAMATEAKGDRALGALLQKSGGHCQNRGHHQDRGLNLRIAMCRAAARAFTWPLCGGEGWSIRPRRGARQGCRALFVRAGARSKSPAAPHGLAGRSPASATRGALLFGSFLLGKQEKVTRAAAAARKPAAGGQAGGDVAAEGQEPSRWMTRCARPFGAALRAFCALRACPASAGMTDREN